MPELPRHGKVSCTYTVVYWYVQFNGKELGNPPVFLVGEMFACDSIVDMYIAQGMNSHYGSYLFNVCMVCNSAVQYL